MHATMRPWRTSTLSVSPSEEASPKAAAARWRLWPRHLHHQLVLMVSLALIAALSLLGGYTAREQAHIALASHEGKATSLARQVAIAARNPIVTKSLDQLEEMALRLADTPEVLDLQVLSAAGRPLTHVQRSGDAPQVRYDPPTHETTTPPSATPTLQREGEHLVVWHPVTTHLLAGWVRLEYDARELQALQWRIWRNTLVVAIMAVVSCGLVLAWVLRGPVQALEHARRFALDMTQSPGLQLPKQSGPIEVEQLNAALNQASALIQEQIDTIDSWLQQHEANEARLAERNAQLDAIFRMSRDGLVTLGQHDEVLFVNRSFLMLTGLTHDEVIGQSLAALSARLQSLASPGSRFEGLHAALPDDDTQPGDSRLSQDEDAQVLVLHEGPQRSVLQVRGQRSQVNQDGNDSTVKGVLYLVDVTRQHTLDQMKSEFLSMAAHELRTPMVSIFGFTELMLKREMKPEQRQELLGSIYRHGQSMIAILNELLDLARIESRRGQDFKFEDTDLATCAQQVLDDYQAPAGRARPVIEAAVHAMPVRADVHKLQQAVLNILSNAYKYSPQGGEVRVRYLSRPDALGRMRHGVSIQDQGLGLSPQDLARLGERFFRVDKSGNIPGTGLGVSIVKELMELMGGHMDVESQLGQGTCVTLWL